MAVRHNIIDDFLNKLREKSKISVYEDDDYINSNIRDKMYFLFIKNNQNIERLTNCNYKNNLDCDLMLFNICKITEKTNTTTRQKIKEFEAKIEEFLLSINQNELKNADYKLNLTNISFDFDNNNSDVIILKTVYSLTFNYNTNII